MRSLAIIGLGSFGASFARGLREQSVEVLAVDARRDAVNAVAEWVPRAVVADATDRRVLEELGVGKMDVAVVSLGDRMDASILTCLHLRALEVREIYVKAISDDHARILEAVGATRVIHPEREVAQDLAHRIAHPGILRHVRLSDRYSILEARTPEGFVGKTLLDLHLRREHGVSVIAVAPEGDPGRLEAPSADEPLPEGSLLVLIGENAALERFEKRFGL